MSRSLPRKRYVHPQNEELRFQQSDASVPLMDGKRFRCCQKAFVRRIRLLFTLLRRYPMVVLFLFLIVWKGLRLISMRNVARLPSVFKTRFQDELTRKVTARFRNEQLIEGFGQQHFQRLSNLRDTPHGTFMDVKLNGAKSGILKLSARDVSTDAPQLEAIPRVHKLAELLHLRHAFAASYRIRLSVVLQEPSADRHTVKALCRACGFRSPSKVPGGATITGDVVRKDPKSLRFMSILHTPTVEPYDWISNLPTSFECGEATFGQTPNGTTQERCQRLTEIMIVMYLAGCAPPSSDAFANLYADEDRNNGVFTMVFPGGCFENYKDNSILLDILVAYIKRSCSIPSGLLRLNKQLKSIGWGVGRRADMLEKQLVFLDSTDVGCRSQSWHFYKASVS